MYIIHCPISIFIFANFQFLQGVLFNGPQKQFLNPIQTIWFPPIFDRDKISKAFKFLREKTRAI